MLISTMIIGWSIIGVIITSGPAAIQRVDAGPFCEFHFRDRSVGHVDQTLLARCHIRLLVLDL